MKKQTLLVTGGAGFIGSHFCDRALSEGYKVICLDNFDPFYDPAIKRQNIAHHQDNSDFTLIDGDILDKDCLKTVFEIYQIVCYVKFYHLVGYSFS